MWKVKSLGPWAHKLSKRSLLLTSTAALLASLALVPTTASAQIAISITPPMCSYGYYDYAPYGCAPMGFYGPGYFFNGIFLGVGPWANWGYGHGWGGHRFSGAGGGSYRGGGGGGRENVGGRESAGRGERSATTVRTSQSSGSHGSASHATAARGSA